MKFSLHCRPTDPITVTIVLAIAVAGSGTADQPIASKAADQVTRTKEVAVVTGDEARTTPELSIESLYHPTEKFDHFSKLAPLHWVRSPDPNAPPLLVTKREGRWSPIDLDTGNLNTAIPNTATLNTKKPSTADLSSKNLPNGKTGRDDDSVWRPAVELRAAISRLVGPQAVLPSEEADHSTTDPQESKLDRYVDRVITSWKQIDKSVLVRLDRKLVRFRFNLQTPPKANASVDDEGRWETQVIASDASDWKDATLCPTDRRIAYTRQGDLYLHELESGQTLRVTDDGSPTILNGHLDWTYQEEIFGRGNFKGFWFSPDGEHLAVLRIDIGQVPIYRLGQTSRERGDGPAVRYPKAGDPIPHAKLMVYAVPGDDPSKGLAVHPIEIAVSTPDDETIVTGVWWHEFDGGLLFTTSDRIQSHRVLHRYDPQGRGQHSHQAESGSGLAKVLLREESSAWVEPPTKPLFLDSGDFLWRTQLPTGRGRLFHVARHGRVVTPMTPAAMHVRTAWRDRKTGTLYVTADINDGLGTQNHVYQFKSGDDTNGLPMTRLTKQVGWHAPDPSPDGGWWIDSYSTIDRPIARTLHASHTITSVPIDASELIVARPLRATSPVTFTANDGTRLPAMLVPPDAIKGRKRLPVLVEVYGGPQSPSAVNRWRGNRRLFREYLARNGIGVMTIDNRSSIDGGVSGSWPVEGKFGSIELSDTLAAVSELKSRSWVDAQAIGISGWSFGGYLTTYAMTHSDAFAAGVAGGSVTQWTEYDAFYTERYMGLPKDNPDGYREASVIPYAKDLSGNLLLIHGEVDDNVHPSGTLRLAAALQREGKLFEMMIYPSQAHAVHSPGQVHHMMRMIDQFLRRQLVDQRGSARSQSSN